MSEYEEPRPPKQQIWGKEQDRIIAAALAELHPVIHEIRPDPNDSMTLAQHLRIVIYDSLKDSYALDAVPNLFRDMSEAAAAKLLEIAAERGAGLD